MTSFRSGRTASKATTTSAIGEGWRAGFTILEILLVLALIGFLSTLFFLGTNLAVLDSDGADAEGAFWEASQKASLDSILTRSPVQLRFDEEAQLFVWGSGGEQRFAVLESKPVKISFLPAAASADGYMLLAGRLVETHQMPGATYYPDGTCSPFRVQVLRGSERTLLEIDPWTCAPVLSREGVASR